MGTICYSNTDDSNTSIANAALTATLINSDDPAAALNKPRHVVKHSDDKKAPKF